MEILHDYGDIQELAVEYEGSAGLAWNYPGLTGRVEPGDEVYLNTTAVELGLGSGGYHFVIANLSRLPEMDLGEGHIMKLRYTPFQLKVMSAEEEKSPYRSEIAAFTSLNGTPVVVGTLHSMLAPAVGGCLAAGGEGLRIVYVMTDGAALPIALSKTVRHLKKKGLLAGTVTCGHAFGGDVEAVNIYSGLVAAYAALKADVIIVTMGPGIVGTGTRWGTTALEQGEILNAVSVLGGTGIAIPRISFVDPRSRHHGVSHHTITALGKVALTSSLIALPELRKEEAEVVWKQLDEGGVLSKHRVVVRDGRPALEHLERLKVPMTSMGRSVGDDPVFFEAAGAAGLVAVELLSGSIRGEVGGEKEEYDVD